jgi:hypothetical protein
MDVGAFVQENKRWLVGVGVGALVYLIGSVVIGSIFDPGAAQSQAAGLLRSSKGAEVYGRGSLDAARAEAEQLAAERQRLQQELAFTPGSKYQLAGKGAPDEYLFQVGRSLKQAVLNAANERDVQLADKDVGWPVPTGVDDIRGVLFGLELLDEAQQRLFAAHDAVRQKNPEAIGLRAILQLKLDERRNQRTGRTSTRPGEVDLRDLVVQERLAFQFHADAATWAAFVEACRQPGRTLAIETFQMQAPTRVGDPCVVKGTLQGIAFKEGK